MPETPEDDRMHPLDPREQYAETVMPEREPGTWLRRLLAWWQAPYLNIEGVLSFYSSRSAGDFRRSLWVRRPDTGWWVVWLEGRGHHFTSLKGRWEWLP